MASMPHRNAETAAENETYPGIGDHAVIGNCRTAALVSREGAIDWLCLPHFSGPSLFAALLDRERGGSLSIRPRGRFETERCYVEGTNVLQTTFHCADGVVRLTDFLTMHHGPGLVTALEPEHELVRVVECLAGNVEVDVIFAPRPDYGAHAPALGRRGGLGWCCTFRGLAAFVTSDIDLEPRDGRARLEGAATLRAGDRRHVVLIYCDNDIVVVNPLSAADRQLEATVEWWRSWSSRCDYAGPHRAMVERSCLTLKALTYCLSGAVIAAATTSLPVGESGARNWDYRYCWLRDTSLVLQSFVDLGYHDEASHFIDWLLHATRLTWPRLQVMYDVFGETALEERELRHLEGYRGLGPVRTGNAAHGQAQHDVYGDVILTAYNFVDRGGVLDAADRKLLAGFGHAVRGLWREPDHGIWEIRLPPRHNTYSKLMCWTAVDRLMKLHERIGLEVDAAALGRERDAIRADIEKHGYDATLGSYVGYYGGRAPDASLLLMARYGFIAADDPRMLGTWRHIERELSVDGLLYRYPPGPDYDGVEGDENLFGICSFWLVDYLARLGEVDRGTRLFEQLLGYANDLGLYAEELHAGTKAPLGNFPQAFTHVGLITAALSLEQARGGKRDEEIAR